MNDLKPKVLRNISISILLNKFREQINPKPNQKKTSKDRGAISTLHHISHYTNCFVVFTMFSTIDCYMHYLFIDFHWYYSYTMNKSKGYFHSMKMTKESDVALCIIYNETDFEINTLTNQRKWNKRENLCVWYS